MIFKSTKFLSYFFVLGHVIGHFCNVLLYTLSVQSRNVLGHVLRQKKIRYDAPPLDSAPQNDRLNHNFVKDEHTYGEKMARMSYFYSEREFDKTLH